MIHFDDSRSNQFLVNPRLNEEERSVLLRLKQELEASYGPNGYFFIPSSGSAKTADQSVKLIALRVEAVLNAARRFQKYFQPQPNDHWGLVLPEFHIAGLSVKARAYLSGSKVFAREWGIEGFSNWISENQIAYISMVPAQVYDLAQAKIVCPPSVKKIFIGAGLLNAELRLELSRLNWPVAETFGMTETCSMIAVRETGNLYTVLPEVEVCLKETLAIRCNSLLTAFAQERHGQVYVSDFKIGDWFATEDLAEISAHNSEVRLRFLGRRYEYVKVLGEGVSLTELRERLEIAASRNKVNPHEVVLLAIEDDRSGHKLILVSEMTAPENRISSLVQDFNDQCRPYEKITSTQRVEQIPRTDLGKLKAEELKAIISTNS